MTNPAASDQSFHRSLVTLLSVSIMPNLPAIIHLQRQHTCTYIVTCCRHDVNAALYGRFCIAYTKHVHSPVDLLDFHFQKHELPAAEADGANQPVSAAQLSPHGPASSYAKQPSPVDSAQGSGASPFSQMSAQATFSENLDTAAPGSNHSAPLTSQQPSSSPHLPEAHQPFGPTADSPFEHPSEQDKPIPAQTSGRQAGSHSQGPASRSGGMDASGSGHQPSDAQVRNSLTAASQPLPPETTADIDAGIVDERHMTISSSSALEDAVQSENASAPSPSGLCPKEATIPKEQPKEQSPGSKTPLAGQQSGAESSFAEHQIAAETGPPTAAASDLFSGLDVDSSRDTT